MLDSLLAATQPLRQITEFTVDGIHREKLGSGNQPWDNKVADIVASTCQQMSLPFTDQYEWFALRLRWFVRPTYYRRDLDNLRLKPILDHLTKNRFWPDDDVRYVRAIYNEAVLIEDGSQERVEVTVYGAMAT